MCTNLFGCLLFNGLRDVWVPRDLDQSLSECFRCSKQTGHSKRELNVACLSLRAHGLSPCKGIVVLRGRATLRRCSGDIFLSLLENPVHDDARACDELAACSWVGEEPLDNRP